MSFHHSACDIHLRGEPGCTFLAAICNNEEGSGLSDNITLDKCLGNDNGHFRWGGRNFSRDARNITLVAQGPDKNPVLHSDLRNSSGDYVPSEIDLATHIANIDGQLVYLC
ncbi:hypothetical protein N7471_008365 [Penicillium samsonianum]|uniref:uncharacterized protein n=1 Tax=Penicillium samsonianum TaxID=1882272 RepID=UPI0025468242|nr:uncharacterized protein N7471_008365 [Penicillium samsonianum]KAJ6133150.1 hypothetical protein N7471_008365 [Penicillium samsonianum]